MVHLIVLDFFANRYI